MRCEKENAAGPRRRILIVDDHPVVTESLSALINREDDLEVCGVAGNANEAMEVLRTGAPDAAIFDISLNGEDGLELIKTAKRHGHRLPILVLSRYEESLYGDRALRAGARGYLTKRQALRQVLEALRRILNGELYFSEELRDQLLHGAVVGNREEDPIERLSDREFQVLRFHGQGLGTRLIAERLHLGVSTVETHNRNIRRKLGLGSSRELVLYAARWSDSQEA